MLNILDSREAGKWQTTTTVFKIILFAGFVIVALLNFDITTFVTTSIIPLLGFIYACYTIYGTGAETVLWGFMLMLIGMPFYVYNKLKNQNLKTPINKKEAA